MTETQPPARVRLREVTPADADAVDALQRLQGSDGGFNDFGMPFEPIDRAALATGPLRNDHNGMVLIERIEDGAVIGTIGWHRVRYGPNVESDAWMFGIDLVPEARGQGFGTEAQRLIAEHLFATTPAHRVEASTDVDNVAEQRALEKAGYTREGINRRAQWRAGGWHDLVLYARLRDDPA
ncbi:MAG: N-acetyltransferase [Chloroflexota bacterium]|nr:MAG: N-acetyltransferase [Chloroflexota bacterium]